MTDWLMVIITTIYVIATIIICVSNYNSAKLSNVSNEINLICKIVEVEQSRLLEFKKVADSFVRNAGLSYQVIDHKESYACIKKMEDSYQLFQRCISIDPDADKAEYVKVVHCAACFYMSSIEICKWLNEEYDGSENDTDVHQRIQKVLDIQSHFIAAKEQYILQREERISKVLLGNVSLNEVRRMYCDDYSKRFGKTV